METSNSKSKKAFDSLNTFFVKPTKLFETMFFYHLSPRNLLVIKRFNKDVLTLLLEITRAFFLKLNAERIFQKFHQNDFGLIFFAT